MATAGRLDPQEKHQVNVNALSDLSFSAIEGERIGIIGGNGAGKTTLLRLLGGVYFPTSGNVSIVGTVGSLIDISLGINPEANGWENIAIRARLLGIPKSELKKLSEEILGFTQLGDFLDLPVRTYSSGMNMRLAFAVATAIRPDILIMDEWLSVGDEEFQQKAEKRLIELVNSSKILFIASHNRHLLEKVCTRILWLEGGRLKADGEPKGILPAYFGS